MTDALAAIYTTALSLLARREHSAFELTQKLKKRYPLEVAAIALALNRLQREAYQSDQRFAEAYLASRLRKGFGASRIMNELAAKGVNRAQLAALAAPAVDECAGNSEGLARAWHKKFKQMPNTPAEKNKQLRFLLYRGFSAAQAKVFFAALADELAE